MPRPDRNATKEERKAYRQGLRNPKKPLTPAEKVKVKGKLDDLRTEIAASKATADNKDKAIEIIGRMERRIARFLTGTTDF